VRAREFCEAHYYARRIFGQRVWARETFD
jgi:hypothetical protein